MSIKNRTTAANVTLTYLDHVPDIIVEIFLSNNIIPPPFECGKAWTHTTPDRLLSPDYIPGIISLVSFIGIIEGRAPILYAMDKYMMVNHGIKHKHTL